MGKAARSSKESVMDFSHVQCPALLGDAKLVIGGTNIHLQTKQR
jgi:hypothetical protein